MVRGRNECGVLKVATYAVVKGSPSPSPSPTPSPSHNCKAASLAYCCHGGTPCDCSRASGASGQCSWLSYEFCCNTGTPCHCSSPSPSPSPVPPPSPAPSPSPPPSPCTACQWNSQCPQGQECYYPSASANSGCCSGSPP